MTTAPQADAPATDVLAAPADPAFFDNARGAFFRRADWLAFGTVFLLSFLFYFHTLAPTVTLEDSGELAVAADYLGAPHPPGYPIWTLLAWFFQWVFHWVRYYGQPDSNWTIVAKSFRDLFAPGGPGGYPNPAWAVGLCSAFFGALACGLLALLISRSGADMLRGIERFNRIVGYRAETWFCCAGGVAGGLLLACSPVLWSQSVIVEVYSLNAFFQTLVLLLLYRWMARPADVRPLYALAFAFGLGLTNHQTLLFLGLAVAVGIAARDRVLFRDFMRVGGLLIAVALFNWLAARRGWTSLLWSGGPATAAFWIHTALFLVLPLAGAALLPRGRTVAATFLLVYLGLSFYVYLVLASEQNPPMNWGYPRTWGGLLHTISRGQYERIVPTDIFSMKFVLQLGAFWRDLGRQFTLPIAVVGAVPFLMLGAVRPSARSWLATTLAAFLAVSLVFITFQNPSLDNTTLFIARVQFIQSHAVYALWIGYGILFGLAWLHWQTGGQRPFLYAGTAVALALPALPLWQNAQDENYLRAVGGAEQNGHDFGWQFGHWQLQGVEAIRREIGEAEWADYPTPGYPPPLAPNAIFFGGTDPGRFVPTYMIYSAHVRPDVYLITQNALADPTYLQTMRDLYGDRIWIPSAVESQVAFQRYLEDRKAGRTGDVAAVTEEEGRVSIEGVQGVMHINGYLSRMIFLANPRHEFYLEESYPIPWMMDHLEPHGLILKINREPADITDAVVARDRAFWDWYTARLLGNPRFRRDSVARKTFSKLRSAIAGLYVHRKRYDDAEHALRQAIALHPASPEAAFRLADLHAQQQEYREAAEVAEAFVAQDPLNETAIRYAAMLRVVQRGQERMRELAARRAGEDLPLPERVELAELYFRYQLMTEFAEVMTELLGRNDLPGDAYAALARLAYEARRYDWMETALTQYLERVPLQTDVRLDLAAVQLGTGKAEAAVASLRQAVELGGESARQTVLDDPRFQPLRSRSDVQAFLVPDRPARP